MEFDTSMWLAAVIVIATLAAMASGKVPPVLALASGLALAGLLGLVPPEAIFAGLSNTGVITVAAMLVIAKGIVQTGVVSRLTWMLLATTRTARQALGRLMGPMGLASAMMNTTPLVAMLIPATRELEETRRIPAREVLLPMAHVTTLAGAVTLIGTSSNLIIAGIAGDFGVEVGMLSFAAVALPVALVGWLVIYLTAPKLHAETVAYIPTKEWRVEIPVSVEALIHHRRASSLGVAKTQQYELIGINRWGQMIDPDGEVVAEDTLIFSATESGVASLWSSPLFGLEANRLYAVTVKSGGGGTLRDFEEDGTVRVVAARTGKPLHQSVIEPGETCFVTADSVEAIRNHESVALWQNAASRVPQPAKTWTAVAILAAVILSASFGWVPIVLASFTGAILMVVTRVLTPGSAARALDWNILAILAGSVGLGAIVVSTGLADAIAAGVRYLSAGSVLLVVIVFAVVTTVMTNLVTNAAAASILTPVALAVAGEFGVEPVLLLALVGTCISFTFINPFSHQSNLMVMRPGGYTTQAFVRFGWPLLLTVMAAACLAAYILVKL